MRQHAPEVPHFDVVDVPLIDQHVWIDDATPVLELPQVLWYVLAGDREHGHLVRLGRGFERDGEPLRPGVVPVVHALPVGDRVAHHHDSRHARRLRSGVTAPAKLLGADGYVIEWAPARPAERAPSRVAVDDAQRGFKGCQGCQEEQNRKQDGRDSDEDDTKH